LNVDSTRRTNAAPGGSGVPPCVAVGSVLNRTGVVPREQ